MGIAAVSTLVLGSLAGIPPAGFAEIEPNPDGGKITQNIVKQNGSAPPSGLPLPAADLYGMAPAPIIAGKIMCTPLLFRQHYRPAFDKYIFKMQLNFLSRQRSSPGHHRCVISIPS